MKKIFLSLALSLGCMLSYAQIITIPDAGFKAILVADPLINTNLDAEIDSTEAASYTGGISIYHKPDIWDLTGIEHFTNIQSIDCNLTGIQYLDLSKNLNLGKINCNWNDLDTLILGSNILLTDLTCSGNWLQKLDITGCPNITTLDAGSNRIDSIDLSNNLDLDYINVNNNLLATLDVTPHIELIHLDCSKNLLPDLDVTQNVKLQYLDCEVNKISPTVNVDLNPLLYYLDCGNNQIANQNTSLNPLLTTYHCDYNNIPSLDVSNNLLLYSFNCSSNQLPVIDVTVNSELNSFYCRNNMLTNIDVTQNLDLNTFDCSANALVSQDVTLNLELRSFYASSISAPSFDLSQNANLNTFYCDGNPITNIDLTQNLQLYTLNCSFTPMASLDLAVNTFLRTLRCNNTPLSTLNLSTNSALSYLNFSNSGIDSIDLSYNTQLSTLRCTNNNMDTLDLINCQNIDYLDCRYNNITALDFDNNSNLSHLYCSYNQIERLDISLATYLYRLQANNNNLSELTIKNGNNEYTVTTRYNTTNNPNLFCVEVSDPLYTTLNWTNIDSWTFYTTDCFYDDVFNAVNGSVLGDSNCTVDGNEIPMFRHFVKSTPEDYFAVTDSAGDYLLKVDSGVFKVEQVLSTVDQLLLKPICPMPNHHIVTFDTVMQDTNGITFYNEVLQCPYLMVDISSNRRRRCFDNKTTVFYGNQGYGDTSNVQVHVKFPQYVDLVSADHSYTIDSNGIYVFTIGTLNAGESGVINIIDHVQCEDGIRGLTQCTKAWITPFNHCIDNMDTTTGVSAGWDKSSLMIEGECVRDSIVEFIIVNTGDPGNGDMQNPTQYRIFINNVLTNTGTVQINGGDTLRFQIPNDGSTIRMEVDQAVGHPGNSHPRSTVEACGSLGNGNVATGFVNGAVLDNEDVQMSEDCLPIIDSYDPNDKQVSPAGVYAQRYVKPDARLYYKIRFQNTGSDTAYKVVVVDSLPSELDVSTIMFGGSSHSYELAVSGQGSPVMKFIFNDIYLPDSLTDELGSQGYFTFSAVAKSTVPEKSIVHNFADIYFDFNEPIRTNTSWVSLFDSVETGAKEQVNRCDTTFPPAVLFYPTDTTVCPNASVQFDVQGGDGVHWHTIENLSDTLVANPIATPNMSTIYLFEVTDQQSCYTTKDSIDISMFGVPQLQVSLSKTEMCLGETSNLTVTGATSFSYIPTSVQAGILAPTTSTNYSIIGTDSAGCTDTTTASLVVYPNPNISAHVTNNKICLGDSVVFTGSGGISYDWDKNVQDGVVYYPTYPTIYHVTGSDLVGCESHAYVRVDIDTTTPHALFEYILEDYDLKLHDHSNLIGTQWTINGVPYYAGEEQPIHPLTEDGIYEVCLYGDGFCSGSDTICKTIVAKNLSVGDDLDNQVGIYPNPTRGLIQIKLPEHTTNAEIVIYDITGRSLYNAMLTQSMSTHDVSKLPKGIYIYKIHNSDNQMIGVGKLDRQ